MKSLVSEADPTTAVVANLACESSSVPYRRANISTSTVETA